MTGIYISFPFCVQKCTYCNFASGVFPQSLVTPYIDALRAEIEASSSLTEPDTLYIGGGTPSLLEPQELRRALSALPVNRWREATIEASPGTITACKAETWSELGIARVSLGVQSFVPEEARATGRKHTPEQVAAELEILRAAGIRVINMDLIAGLAHQTAESWQRSLDWIEGLEPEHVSVYMLEVDDESRLGEELRRGGSRYGARSTPGDDETAAFYQSAIERLKRMSIEQYEISNFSRPGHESIHNLKYWNMEPYAGFGADAHSFDGFRRWNNVASVVDYIERWRAGKSVRAETEEFDAGRRLQERFFTGLRQTAGVRISAPEAAPFSEAIERLLGARWLEWTNDRRLRLTSEGVLFSNEVFQEFLNP